MRYDWFGGLIWMAIGIAMLIGSAKLKLGTFQKPGPGFMPFLTGCSLALLGFILSISSLKLHNGTQEISIKKFLKKGVQSLIASIIYVFLIDSLGFIVTTFLFIFILLKIMGTRKWFTPFFISLITVGLSYLIFIFWLRINFPRGILRIG